MIQVQKARYNGILLPGPGIGFDFSGDGAEHVFISHAHSDHIPRKAPGDRTTYYSTGPTAEFMKLRGVHHPVRRLDFGETIRAGNARVTFYPAGHILGSAMAYVEVDGETLLYTGDYRTPPSPASEGFELPGNVDHFITEATFSLPIYKWPEQEALEEEIRSFALDTLEAGKTPLFLAYNLGKAQEIMHMLAPLERSVQIHEAGYKMCEIYEQAGISLGNYSAYDPGTCEGCILIAPVQALNNGFASHVTGKRIAYCSGWAVRETSRTQLTVDKFIPLSDHLDFFELLDVCKNLDPVKVYITHTPNAGVLLHYLDSMNIPSVILDRETGMDN